MVRRMSPYERRRRGNARRSGGQHHSRAGNTMPGQRDSGHLAVPSDIRTQNRSTSCCEAGTNLQANRSRGVYASSALKPLTITGRPAGYQPRSEPDSGKPTVRDRRGLLGNVADGGIRNPCCKPKGRTWSLFAFLCARPGSTRQGRTSGCPDSGIHGDTPRSNNHVHRTESVI